MDPKYNSNPPISPEEITPRPVYLSRRKFMAGLALAGAAGLLAACAPAAPGDSPTATTPADLPTGLADELGDPANRYEEITNYNNYYEFSMGKESVARLAAGFPTSPWQVEVYGLVSKPRVFGMADILTGFEQEERIYRLRCVEGWSMVIPWTGFSLAKLLEQVEPTPQAKYVRFETVLAPEAMPGQNSSLYPFPYQEGLRLDEAMHSLTILATGLYGQPLPNQNGAPIRLVVPWKYGFKSIKGIVKIELVADQPVTFWNTIAPQEYGFYANVNPDVPHPRWSQASERRIGEAGRRETLKFNGYGNQVAGLYEGLDLKANY